MNDPTPEPPQEAPGESDAPSSARRTHAPAVPDQAEGHAAGQSFTAVPRKHWAGSDWLVQSYGKKFGGPISDLGRRVADLLGEIAFGLYHIDERSLSRVDWRNERFISIVLADQSWATYDFDALTRLVVLCHDRCIRIEIIPASKGKMRLLFHGRSRTGGMSERHPTMEQAVAACRAAHGEPEAEGAHA